MERITLHNLARQQMKQTTSGCREDLVSRPTMIALLTAYQLKNARDIPLRLTLRDRDLTDRQ